MNDYNTNCGHTQCAGLTACIVPRVWSTSVPALNVSPTIIPTPIPHDLMPFPDRQRFAEVRMLYCRRCGITRAIASCRLPPLSPCPFSALVESDAATIDAAHLARQAEFSFSTFGPGKRTQGVLDHIRKELIEIEADPLDLDEWVDVVILGLDGAWRAGWEPQQIIDAIKAKQARNEARSWPDWRTIAPDKAIEHEREFPSHTRR